MNYSDDVPIFSPQTPENGVIPEIHVKAELCTNYSDDV